MFSKLKKFLSVLVISVFVVSSQMSFLGFLFLQSNVVYAGSSESFVSNKSNSVTVDGSRYGLKTCFGFPQISMPQIPVISDVVNAFTSIGGGGTGSSDTGGDFDVPSNTPTPSPRPSPRPTVTSKPTVTSTNTPTNTPTDTPTDTPTPKLTSTPTMTMTPTCTPTPTVVKYLAPTDLSAVVTDNKVKLTWKAPKFGSNDSGLKNLSGYDIYRGTSSGKEEYVPINEVLITPDVCEFVDLKAESGKMYYYICKCRYGDLKQSNPSNEASVLATIRTELKLIIDNPTMFVNGESKELDPGRGTVPIIYNNRTLIPIRAVIEAMNGKVDWVQSGQKIELSLKGSIVDLWVDRNEISVNGQVKSIDVSPKIINSRTFVPIRFVAESFGFEVIWDGNTKVANIIW